MTHHATSARQILVSTQASYKEALDDAEHAQFHARKAEDRVKAIEAALKEAQNLAAQAHVERREANRKVQMALLTYKTAEISYNKERAIKEAEETAKKAEAAMTTRKRAPKASDPATRTMVHRKSR